MSKFIFHGSNVIVEYTREEIQNTLDYWTAERIKTAEPVPMPIVDIDPSKIKRLDRTEPFQDEPNVPTEADITTPPYSRAGKLLFTMDTKSGYGSAEFCGNNRIALTAAHCIFKDGLFKQNMVLHRGYKNGASAQIHPVTKYALKLAWLQNEGYKWDYAFMITDTPADGYFEFVADGEGKGISISFGYPSDFSGGEIMQKVDCIGDFEYKGCIGYTQNPFTGGCSGGGIICNFGKNAVKIISLNSWGSSSFPNTMFGPIFDEETTSLYNAALAML
jgi:hypothetical protein